MILNRAGSLLFDMDFAAIPKMKTNDRIMLASTFHGLSAIAGQLSPAAENKTADRIQVLEADNFKLQSFVPLTGRSSCVVPGVVLFL
jgi:hypothetical protein